jgi:hypothetical protein
MSWNLWYSKNAEMPWIIMEVGGNSPKRVKHVAIACDAETANESPHKDFNTVMFTVRIHGEPKFIGDNVIFV